MMNYLLKSTFLGLFLLLSFRALSANQSYDYQSGFGNQFESEAIENALPKNQNNPQMPAYGLYAEQLSGTSFTTPRDHNQRTWLYRIRPSALQQGSFIEKNFPNIAENFDYATFYPDPQRWLPFEYPKAKSVDFVEGLKTIAGNGDPGMKAGLAIHVYTANASMGKRSFFNSDGDFLIVPQEGSLDIQTECGFLTVAPGEICVIPRGIQYRINLQDEQARGYVCEIYNGHFKLPDLGPIGANGLANPRDFLYPVAAYEDLEGEFFVINKFGGKLFEAKLEHSPFDVVAFHGNYLPYKYDLNSFCPMNSVAFDHADPSIFTVLTAPSFETGVALVDFVIFPPRWLCAEKTFRPPYFHRNCMSEFMGLIHGRYEAKKTGFLPGGASLHNCMTAHGPDKTATDRASNANLAPAQIKDTLAFMFESTLLLKLTEFATEPDLLDQEYKDCWSSLEARFDANTPSY